MNFEKLSVVKLSNNKKIIILEKLDYQGITYLYVDDVKEDESDTLDNYYIMRVNNNGTIQKEENIEVLTKIIPELTKLVKADYQK